MHEIVEEAGDLGDLRRDYLASLDAPLDGMWEAFALQGRQREIWSAGRRVGYFSLNDEGQVLQFHVSSSVEAAASELFALVLARKETRGALVSTADSLALGLCLDTHRELQVHSLLYRDHDRDPGPTELEGDPPMSLQRVEAAELQAVAELQRESLDWDPGDWLVGYLEMLIERRELFASRSETGEIVATGEVRVSDSQPPHADLGVITMRRHRGKGVASRVLRRLKRDCYERDLVPICSTTRENLAARHAIESAGFVSRYRILQVEL